MQGCAEGAAPSTADMRGSSPGAEEREYLGWRWRTCGRTCGILPWAKCRESEANPAPGVSERHSTPIGSLPEQCPRPTPSAIARTSTARATAVDQLLYSGSCFERRKAHEAAQLSAPSAT